MTIECIDQVTVLHGGRLRTFEEASGRGVDCGMARNNTLAGRILAAHAAGGDGEKLTIRFDSLASHDITYVSIIQTARASGLREFPIPYVLTNCHNSLCAVGGTINEDDHRFGLSAAKRYGGVFVPPNLAVIHQYVREMAARPGDMILASDSHTRYGALGVMGFGEGGPEIVKQLLGKTYDLARPQVVLVWLTGEPQPGVGPQDVALALIGAVFRSGFAKNKVLEFQGPGIASLSVEYRCGIDVMTTETACLSSIWKTDGRVAEYMKKHGRAGDYKSLEPLEPAAYDACIRVDLSTVEPMIALPFHPSNAYPIREFLAHGRELLAGVDADAARQFGPVARNLNMLSKYRDGGVWADQGIIAGCAGGSFENISLASAILNGRGIGNDDFSLSLYPASEPQALALVRNGSYARAMASGGIFKSAICGPCFGAGDTPANGAFSIRHSTRNFPNREGSKPNSGQLCAVALMDARSIAATAANGGRITPATDCDWQAIGRMVRLDYQFDADVYKNRIYNGFGRPQPDRELVFGPNITDWPAMTALPEHLLLRVASVITDPVTTTDELIPSGETSALRSNPLKLAEFTLSRKDPGYVGRAVSFQKFEETRRKNPNDLGLSSWVEGICAACGVRNARLEDIGLGTTIFAIKPGDGSAREQAASCQKVLGGWANLAVEYATKRYRSNLINWGMLPFLVDEGAGNALKLGDLIFVPYIRMAIRDGKKNIPALLVRCDAKGKTLGKAARLNLGMQPLTEDERRIILAGSLINFYNAGG